MRARQTIDFYEAYGISLTTVRSLQMTMLGRVTRNRIPRLLCVALTGLLPRLVDRTKLSCVLVQGTTFRRFRCCIDFLRPGERPLTHPRLSCDYTLFILLLESTPNRWWELGRSLVSLVSDCHFSFVFLETKNLENHE